MADMAAKFVYEMRGRFAPGQLVAKRPLISQA